MTYGNYDAGQSKQVNPYFDGGLRFDGTKKVGFNFDFGFNKVDKVSEDFSVGSEMGFVKTGNVNKGIEATAVQTYANIQSTMMASADNDRFVDEMLSPYITAETRGRMANTSFNAAMILGALDDVYGNLG